MTRGQHLDRVEIRRFRGLSDLNLDKLGSFNLLLGPNDVGKTSVIEAIFLLSGTANLRLPRVVQNRRGLPTETVDDLRTIFHNLDPDQSIELAGHSSGPIACRKLRISTPRAQPELIGQPQSRTNGGNARSQLPEHFESGGDQASSLGPRGPRVLQYEGEVQPRQGELQSFSGTLRGDEDTFSIDSSVNSTQNLILPARYINPRLGYDATAISTLVVHKQVDRLVSFMKNINPHITDVNTGGDLAYVDVGLAQMVPLNVFGSGMIRAVSVLSHVLSGDEGILLLDELENGLYHTAVDSFLRALLALSHEGDVQIFASPTAWACWRAS